MLSISHTLISLPFGIYLHNPFLIFSAAFIFHIFCDTLLHWNIYPFRFKTYPYLLILLDVAGGLLAAWLLLGDQVFSAATLAAIAGGNMPDLLNGVWDILKILKRQRYLNFLHPFFDVHDRLQLETLSASRGLISQIILITFSFLLIYLANN